MTDLPHADASNLGIYLYCLARPECLSAVNELARQALCGVDERYPVDVLADDTVVAVVGEVTIAEFSEQNLQTLAWVGSRAGRHEAVVEQVLNASPVLPVKFGTIFRSQASLKQFLDRHREDIEQALDKLRGKTEWSVKGYLVEEDARRCIAAADAEVQSRIATLSSSPGLRYLQQKQLETMIDAALEASVAQVAHDLHQSLALHSVSSTALRRHTNAVTGRPERMVFNGSFLLTPEAFPAFQAVLTDQQETYKAIGLTLELRGPWPPYNFCPNLSGAEL